MDAKPVVMITISVSVFSPVLGTGDEKEFTLKAYDEDDARAMRPEAKRLVDEFIKATMGAWERSLEGGR